MGGVPCELLRRCRSRQQTPVYIQKIQAQLSRFDLKYSILTLMRQSSRLGVLPSLKWGVGAMRWASINSATPKKLTKKEALIEANMNRVYIMDGTAMLYKAYHAGLAHSRITATPEVEVQSTLRQHCEKFLNQIKPHYLAVVLDHGKKIFRHELMPEYKETRGEVSRPILLYRDILRSLMCTSVVDSGGDSRYLQCSVTSDCQHGHPLLLRGGL